MKTETFIQRFIQLPLILKKNSFFLFGPRSTGKSYLINQTLPNIQKINLLDTDIYQTLLKRPMLLEEIINPKSKLVVVDEIQKIPPLLDCIHKLIEERKIHFLLTGSSARKLKRSGVNLLGGRAWESQLFPLTSLELDKKFDLLTYLNSGGLPKIYLSAFELNKDKTGEKELTNFPKYDRHDKYDIVHNHLKAYCHLYLSEEIQQEALVRNLDLFARFLDASALTNGEELHYTNLSNDCSVPVRTIENYIQVLVDTLIGFNILPFTKTKKRKAITRSKFFLFDIGVTNFLSGRGEIKKGSELFGKAFEHFIALELRAYLSYNNRREPLMYWRTKNGFEVDFVVGNQLAIEVKSSNSITHSELRGLNALLEEKLVKTYAVVSQEKLTRYIGEITIYPWKEFLKLLWSHQLF